MHEYRRVFIESASRFVVELLGKLKIFLWNILFNMQIRGALLIIIYASCQIRVNLLLDAPVNFYYPIDRRVYFQ